MADVPLREGKTKRLLPTEVPGRINLYFKDEVSLQNGKSIFTIPGKGAACAQVSLQVFRFLAQRGVENHLVKESGDRLLLVDELEMLPIEVVVWNFACGSLPERLGFEPGAVFREPLVEFFLKDDSKDDPLVTVEHLEALGLLRREEVEALRSRALKINGFLRDYFDSHGIILGSVKLEFGKLGDHFVLGDEVSPDTCLMWEKEGGKPLGRMAALEGRREPEIYARVVSLMEEKPGKEAYVYVRPKQGIMDPQGQVTMRALRDLGFSEVEDVRVGRYIILRIREGSSRERLEEMCRRLLANPVIEDYEIRWDD